MKIGTKDEAIWTKVVTARKVSIASLEEALIIERAFLKMAEDKLSEAIKNR